METVKLPGTVWYTNGSAHTATQNTDVSLSQEFQKHFSNEPRKHGIIDNLKQNFPSKTNWTNRKYHVQHNKDVKHQEMTMYCATNQSPELKFLGPHNKPYGVCVFCKNYQMIFDTKLVHVTYSICRIHCGCTLCTSSLGWPWIPCFPAQQQPRYQTIKYFTYWPVLGSFNSWKILKLSLKATSGE